MVENGVSRCGRKARPSSSEDGWLMIVECVRVDKLSVRNQFLLYSFIFVNFFSGLTIRACALSIYFWSIVSNSCDGNRAEGRRYSSVFLYFHGTELGLLYGCTSKLLLPKSEVMTNGHLAL